jgi:predicted transcriptional regulator YheO
MHTKKITKQDLIHGKPLPRPKADEMLFDQLKQIAKGLGQTFAPFCEVVVHDLTDPKNAIVCIENNLSGRAVGDPATQLGLARMADSSYPQVISNYPNKFADGRRAKSTSIGIKDHQGTYVAALCLNVDLTMLQGVQSLITQFVRTETDNSDVSIYKETIDPTHANVIRARIDAYAASLATTSRALKTKDRRLIVQELSASGAMELRNSADLIAKHLGVSRATVYSDVK